MGQLFDGVSFENGGLDHPLDWESKYIQQLELKKQLQQTIKKLEKQNEKQGKTIEKQLISEDNKTKLAQLQEELRVWKQKYATLLT